MAYAWVLLSLVSAFALATSDAFTKRVLETHNEYLVAWSRLLCAVPLLASVWLFIPFPEPDREFYKAFAFSLPLEILAMVFYIKALKFSPLSLTLPLLSFTPVLLIVISYLIVGEKVSFQGGVGICLLAAGSYTLHLHEMKKGLLQPFRSLMHEKGSLLMIGVALIYSITSSLGKMAIQHSSALFFGTVYFVVLTLAFTPVALWMGRSEIKTFISGKQIRRLIIPGLLYSIMVVSHMIAMSLTKVAYMIALKRTSVIIGIVYGYFLFKEKNIRQRMTGAIIMLTGFIMIVTAV
jgi:drug/metabolite transporter (DMT)-like permease